MVCLMPLCHHISLCVCLSVGLSISSWMQKLNEYLFWETVKNKLTCCSATKTYRTLFKIINKDTLNKQNYKWKIDKIKWIYKYIKYQIIYHTKPNTIKAPFKIHSNLRPCTCWLILCWWPNFHYKTSLEWICISFLKLQIIHSCKWHLVTLCFKVVWNNQRK